MALIADADPASRSAAPSRRRGWRLPAGLAGLQVGLLVWGLALRLVLYFQNRSFWGDEAVLGTYATPWPSAGLLAPAEHGHAVPLGFLTLVKGATLLAGPDERGLRLVPLLAGLGALLLFPRLARRYLCPLGATIALAIFALSDPLIYYASEFKPYSLDVFVTVVLLLLLPRLLSQPGRGGLAGAAALGVLVVWLSYPAAFVLAGVGLSFGGPALWRRDWPAVGRLGLVGAAWGLSCVGIWLLTARTLTRYAYLQTYWAETFVPLPPTSLREVYWYLERLFVIFDLPLGLYARGLALLAASVGLLVWWRRGDRTAAILLSPLLVTVLASGLRLYPFGGRLLLFAVPSLALLVAAGAARLWRQGRPGLPLLGPALVGLLLLQPALAGAYHLLPRKCETARFGFTEQAEAATFINARLCDDARSVLAELGRQAQPGDVVYLDPQGERVFSFYAPRFGLDGLTVVERQARPTRESGFYADLAQLRGRDRVWLLFTQASHGALPGEDPPAVLRLDAEGRQLVALQRGRVSLYLYDLSS